MINILLIIHLCLMIILSSCSESIEYDSLVERNGIMYKVNSEKSYSGKAFGVYENDQQSLRCAFQRGKLEGPFTEWHRNGQLKIKSMYSDGSPKNDYTEWYENGQIKYMAKYSDCKKSGVVRSYWPNGNKKLVENFKDGMLHGKSTTFDVDGKIEKRSEFKGGLLHGNVIEYAQNGAAIFEGTYLLGKEYGEHSIQDSLGNLISLTVFDSTGNPLNTKYFSLDEAKKQQMYRFVRYTDGEITNELGYSDGELLFDKIDSTLLGIDYKRYKFYLNGEVFIDNVIRSGWVEKHWPWKGGGLAKKYQVNSTGFIKDGKYHEYDEDSNLWIEGNYRNGSKSGMWKWFNKYGAVTNTEYN